MYFCYFVIISPWKSLGHFIWITLISLHPRMLCAKFSWNWPSGSWEEEFLIASMYFRYFIIISPWKRAGLFIWTNLNPLHSRMHCAKFVWNWHSGSGEELLISSMYFCYFLIISPWKRAGPSFEQTWIPFIQGFFVPSLVENCFSTWFWRRRFFNFVNVFLLFRNYLPLNKCGTLLNKFEAPSPKVLCTNLVEIGSVILKNKIFKFCQCIFTFSSLSPFVKV